ncbi:flagellar biosynthesis protein FlhB [Pseudomonadota bacterium]
MAEETGQERTEEPTAKRLSDARKKGQVARSKELTTTAMLVGSAFGLIVFGSMIVEGLLAVMYHNFSMPRDKMFDTVYMVILFQESLLESLLALGPFFVVMTISAIIGTIAMSGWNFSIEAIAPKLSKLSPLSGLKRIFGPQGLMELAKALAKFFVITTVGITVLWGVSDTVLGLGHESVEQAIAHAGTLVLWAFLAVSLSTILIAVIDVPFQMWNHKRQLKMTRQEVKQENKETDGSPEVKQRIRQAQYDLAMRRMMEAIPEADVVITNPTHFSVAVKYDQENMRAPIVVAKGADYVAFEIRRIAVENNVPILSSPPLARSIYHTTEVDDEIPEGLYIAVARVLAYIFHLRKTTSGVYDTGDLEMDDLPIPDEMRYGADGKPEDDGTGSKDE